MHCLVTSIYGPRVGEDPTATPTKPVLRSDSRPRWIPGHTIHVSLRVCSHSVVGQLTQGRDTTPTASGWTGDELCKGSTTSIARLYGMSKPQDQMHWRPTLVQALREQQSRMCLYPSTEGQSENVSSYSPCVQSPQGRNQSHSHDSLTDRCVQLAGLLSTLKTRVGDDEALRINSLLVAV